MTNSQSMFSAGRRCRAAQDFRAERQLWLTSKVNDFFMRPGFGERRFCGGNQASSQVF
jgi:hypothetical protein